MVSAGGVAPERSFLADGGETGALIRGFDWRATPLGPPEGWRPSLKAMVRMALSTRHPIFIFWGEEGTCLYNDAYSRSLGPEKHPWILGAPALKAWPEIWATIGPQIDAVMRGDGATWHENQLVPILRHGELQEVYWTYSFGPIDDEAASGGIGGVLVVCTETTAQVRSEQRQKFRVRLDDALRDRTDAREIMDAAAELLGAQLGADRAGYGEIDASAETFVVERQWSRGDMSSLVGRHRLDDFGPDLITALKAGRTVALDDILQEPLTKGEEVAQAFEAATVRSAITVPRIKAGRLEAVHYVHCRNPRRWTEEEEMLVRDVAERTWSAVERAHAETELHELNATLERRVAERARDLEQAQDALRQAQKMEAVGQLTGGIAHDFNNLLQGLSGSLDLIRRKPDDVTRVRRWAEAGLQADDRGAKLTGQLLAFSRAQRLESKSVVVADLVSGMGDLLARTLGPKVQVRLDLDGSGVTALCDPTQLEMSVLNLAINARDAMTDPGELVIATRLCALDGDPELPSGEYVEVAVSDTGAGMPPEVAARAFDPFFTTKAVGQGTGLGLSQVYASARQAGGTARIESQEGGGTVVRLLLQRTANAVARAPEQNEEVVPSRSVSQTILVVDDDPDVRRFLLDSLDALGFRVIEAEDGYAGLAALDRSSPDLMILDYAMPGITGAEVAQAARERRPDLPIVFASGYSDTKAIEDVAGESAPVLRKPFRIDELQAVLTKVLFHECGSRLP